MIDIERNYINLYNPMKNQYQKILMPAMIYLKLQGCRISTLMWATIQTEPQHNSVIMIRHRLKHRKPEPTRVRQEFMADMSGYDLPRTKLNIYSCVRFRSKEEVSFPFMSIFNQTSTLSCTFSKPSIHCYVTSFVTTKVKIDWAINTDIKRL